MADRARAGFELTDYEVACALKALARDHHARTSHGVSYSDDVAICEVCEWRAP